MSELLNLVIKAHGGLDRWTALCPHEPRTLHSPLAACKFATRIALRNEGSLHFWSRHRGVQGFSASVTFRLFRFRFSIYSV
jgi:hypothetical protein